MKEFLTISTKYLHAVEPEAKRAHKALPSGTISFRNWTAS
jgi:hypothetical protein